MDLKPTRYNSWVIPLIVLASCAAFFLGGLPQAVFIVIALGSIWSFFKTVNRRLFAVFPRHGDLPLDNIPKRL